MKKILVLGDLSKKKISDTISGLKPWLEKYVRTKIVDLSKEKKFENPEAEIAMVFGGDGAILSTCRGLGRNQIPIIGVHMGRFGFLAELIEKKRVCLIRKNLCRKLSGTKKNAPFVPYRTFR